MNAPFSAIVCPGFIISFIRFMFFFLLLLLLSALLLVSRGRGSISVFARTHQDLAKVDAAFDDSRRTVQSPSIVSDQSHCHNKAD